MIGESKSASELIKSYTSGQRSFRNANLSGLELTRAQLPEIDLQGAYLRWADFQGANLKLANLSWADLQKANLSDATLQRAVLKEANLRKANLQWADLQEAQLQGANLFQSHLMCANFRGASLRLANLEAADLDKAELSGVDLRVANLVEAQLRNADLKQGKLQGANLSKANLTGANLEGVNLQGANLRGAKLFGANLQNANLQQANLEDADLTEAKLFGANLQGANRQKTILPSQGNMSGSSPKSAQLLSPALPTGEILEEAVVENGLASDSFNVVKSLPQAAKTESPVLLSLLSDTQEAIAGDRSEAVLANLTLDRPLILLGENNGAKIDAEIDADLTGTLGESSGEPEPISEKVDVQISQTKSLDLPLEFGGRDRGQPDRNRTNHYQTNHYQTNHYQINHSQTNNYRTKSNAEPEEFLELTKQRMGENGHFTSVSLAIAKRRGPSTLRQRLLEAYQGRCSMTGCEVEPILEVAFLQPNQPTQNSDPSHGLLLRADVHTLFDLHLIAIDPETLNIIVAPTLRNTTYGSLHQKPLRQATLVGFQPNQELLKLRLQWSSWFNASP
jgi:uncharacterized protein YjbI with pentapeptide repeats